MSLANAYEEKRNFIRMRVESPLTLTMGEKAIQCLCIDLSGIGMCIESPEPFNIGDEAVAYLPSYQEKFSALNAVIRINREMKDGDQYYYGAEIIELLG